MSSGFAGFWPAPSPAPEHGGPVFGPSRLPAGSDPPGSRLQTEHVRHPSGGLVEDAAGRRPRLSDLFLAADEAEQVLAAAHESPSVTSFLLAVLQAFAATKPTPLPQTLLHLRRWCRLGLSWCPQTSGDRKVV